MHLILTGATGLVGSATLHAMLRNQSITKISIISRRLVPQASSSKLDADKRCQTFIQKDFAVPPPAETLSQLGDARGVVWAQGISVNEVSADEYKKITYDYPLVAAKAFAGLRDADSGEPFNFVYVSGEGATTSPGFATPRFARVKGEAEAALLEVSKQEVYKSLRVFSARPGAIDYQGHPEAEEAMNGRPLGFAKKLEKPMLSVLRATWKAMISPTRELGNALVILAAGDGKPATEGSGVSGEGRTLGNVALRRIAGI